MRRKRFQKGSLQTRKHGHHRVWAAFWWEDGSRRSKVLGRRSQMSQGEAEAILSAILQPINSGVTQGTKPVYTFQQLIEGVYLPFCRRSWKESTEGTSEQIIKSHLVPVFRKALLHAIPREELPDFLDRKALDLSSSPVKHLRWFLNANFKLAVSDGLLLNNPAAELRIPKKCRPGRTLRPLTEEEVHGYLEVFGLRERLIARLAIFESMRPGEILGTPMEVHRRRRDQGGTAGLHARAEHAEKWQDPRRRDVRRHARIVKRVGRSGAGAQSGWLCLPVRDDLDSPFARQSLAAVHVPKLERDRAGLGNVPGSTQNQCQPRRQIRRRSRKSPRIRRGHGLDVSLDVYTSSDMEQKRAAVKKLEAAVLRKPQPERRSA